MKATPEDPEILRSDGSGEQPANDGAEDEPPTEEEEEEEKNRHLRLRAKDFARYGHSDECAGCARMRRGAKPPYRHNSECRQRLERCLARIVSTRVRLLCHCGTCICCRSGCCRSGRMCSRYSRSLCICHDLGCVVIAIMVGTSPKSCLMMMVMPLF